METGVQKAMGRFKLFNFGKSPVPEEAVTLHHKNFQKVASLAKKITRMDDEKFTNEDFLLYVRFKIKIEKGIKESDPSCQSIKYIEVGVATQSSFMKLEQTELRYRSRRQQEFYKFVTDNITDEVNKAVFRDLIKRKLGESLPLISSEEGRNALKSYAKEVEIISQHNLGLKLLSLFKEYELDDFTILRRISDLVEQVKAQDMMNHENLMVLALENHEMFEKIAPVLGISSENTTPKFFTEILQYLSLGRRHEKAESQFQSLIKVIKQWRTPFRSVNLIRKQYNNGEYKLPKEFFAEIPGLNVYQKYKEYLNLHQ